MFAFANVLPLFLEMDSKDGAARHHTTRVLIVEVVLFHTAFFMFLLCFTLAIMTNPGRPGYQWKACAPSAAVL